MEIKYQDGELQCLIDGKIVSCLPYTGKPETWMELSASHERYENGIGEIVDRVTWDIGKGDVTTTHISQPDDGE